MIWKLPTSDEPGFLRRKRELTKLLDAEPTPENLDAVLTFLAPFVEGGEEALLDATQSEYGAAIVYLMGYSNTVSDPKGVSSGLQSGTEQTLPKN